MSGAKRTLAGLVVGGVAGIAAGGTVAATQAATTSGRAARAEAPAPLIEATHLPPLLTLAGERPRLRYDVYCAAPDGDPESGAPCDAAGTVYDRAGDRGPFRALPLQVDRSASEGRYWVDLPPELAAAPGGFSYYAVLWSRTTGATTVLPPGGPFAPQLGRPLAGAVDVDLGAHVFGLRPIAPARVASAAWGSGPGQVGLEQDPGLQPIGGSSFDVGAEGAVSLLDEANRRVLRFVPGRAQPTAVPVGVRGTIADLAVQAGGAMTVMETVGDDGATPLLRTFSADGELLGAVHLAERGAGAVATGPDGPQVLEYPAGQWMPVVRHGAGLAETEQRRSGRAGRTLGAGSELVVEREGGEVRVADVGPEGIRHAWRIRSATPLGEVQLARLFGDDLVPVLRVYTDAHDEFEVLVVDAAGVVQRFAVDSAAWAETAPLARFRFQGSSLYELGSTAAGVTVDRYDLRVTR